MKLHPQILRRCYNLDVGQEQTTAVVQRYLDQLAEMPLGEAPAEPIVRELLAGAVNRLHLLCRSMLVRNYSRLTKPPLSLRPEEMLSAVTERMLKAMRQTRPETVRQFFALANQHVRWELNDVARRLDRQELTQEVLGSDVPAPIESSGSQLSSEAARILEAIANLPDDEREVFDLLRIQEMTQPEAAEVLGVGVRTIQRRLHRALFLLAKALPDLRPAALNSNEASR
jgi:RNA polymerase sigma-70 factor (ECF subfamily)